MGCSLQGSRREGEEGEEKQEEEEKRGEDATMAEQREEGRRWPEER
jgi:hypothetical protein